MNVLISVIVCTHNPKVEIFARTLLALKQQILGLDKWELLLIDNASKQRLSEHWDLSWHHAARHIREDELGLTPARLRGISEARADLIVFVDDDNILDPQYLQNALTIGGKWEMLGVWGGRIDPEFEVLPPEWTKPFWGMLAIHPVEKELWSNDPRNIDAQPCGAGMCVRKRVALAYAQRVLSNPLRKSLGRIGSALGSCEDLDLVQTAPDLGLGFGLFPNLRLLHIMPAGRLEEDYLMRIYEGTLTSVAVLQAARGLAKPPQEPSVGRKIVDFIKYPLLARLDRRMCRARQRAFQTAREIIEKMG